MSLQGVRVAVTRTPAQASELVRLLGAEGASVAPFPLIRVRAHERAALAHALRNGPWDWVVFTSANAVRFSIEALQAEDAAGAQVRDVLGSARVACVGSATARSAEQAGLVVASIPEQFVGAAVADAMVATADVAGTRVLWPRGEASAAGLAVELRAAGAEVTAPVAYRTELDEEGARALARATLQGDIDVVTFTSPSAVRSLASVLPAPIRARVAVIGPVTAAAARAAGYRIDAVAAEHTVAGLVDALRGLYD